MYSNEGMIAINEAPKMAPVIPITVDRSLKKIPTVIHVSTMITVISASFQYSIPHAPPHSPTRVLKVEGLHDHLAHRVAVQREGEAQREGDDQTTHQNQRIQRGVAVQCVRRLPIITPPSAHRVAAEAEVPGHGVGNVQSEDQEIREEHNSAHTLLGRLLHLRHDGDELHLRAVAEAEDRQHGEQVLVENETPQLGVRSDDGEYRGLDGVGFAALAEEGALVEAGVVGDRRVGFDQALTAITHVLGDFGQTACVGLRGTVEHLAVTVKSEQLTTMVM